MYDPPRTLQRHVERMFRRKESDMRGLHRVDFWYLSSTRLRLKCTSRSSERYAVAKLKGCAQILMTSNTNTIANAIAAIAE